MALGLALLPAGCADRPSPSISPPPAAQLAAILPFVTPRPAASGLAADEPSPPSLERVGAAIGEASIVGLGESEHGVDDLHRLSHRLFGYLADKKDFSVYALEVDQIHAALLDDYVHGRRDDLDALLAARHPYAIFYDRALRDLVVDLRRQNLEQGRDLSVAGFDLKQPALAMDRLMRVLQRVDPGAAKEAARLYVPIAELGGYGVVANVAGYSGSFELPLSPSIKPRRLEIALAARGSGLTFGSAGLFAESRGKEWLNKSIVFRPGDLVNAWQEGRLEIEVPADASALRFVVYHRGNGSLLFRNLEVRLDGAPLGVPGLETWKVLPLLYPATQVMDYRARIDVEGEAAFAFRIDADPRLDQALAAARELRRLVDATLEQQPRALTTGEAAWLRQAGRLIEQAVHWRTLVEPNRDVLLAENLAWLHETGYPGRKILALAHASHSQRVRGRMGEFLAAEVGSRYATVSMIPLSGSLRDDDGPPTFELRVQEIDRTRSSPLDRELAALVPGDFQVDLAAAKADPAASRWLEELLAGSRWPPAELPEMAIYLHGVQAFKLLGDGRDLVDDETVIP